MYALNRAPAIAPTHRRPFLVPRRRALGRLGAATQLVRPGPNGGTEIVDSSGNILYTETQVAANPSLLTSVPQSTCPNGMLPTWEPGGESLCAGSATDASGTVISPQYNSPIDGACMDGTWCLTGSDPTNPASYTWTGGGTPTSLNPAIMLSAAPLPANYQPANTVIESDPSPAPATTPPPSAPTAPKGGNATVNPYPLTSPMWAIWNATNVASVLNPTAPRVALANLTSPGRGNNFQVGDLWQLTISGAPNQDVSNTATQNGQSHGAASYGNTDGNGNFTLSGTMTNESIGVWTELWSVGGTPAGTLVFTVVAAPAASTPAASTTAPATTAAAPAPTNYVATPSTSPALTPAAWLSESTIFSGFPNGVVLGAGILALFLIAGMGGKK